MISFIIPYKYHPERHKLFLSTIKNIPERNNIRICVIEMDKNPSGKAVLWERRDTFYGFIKWEGIFNRALAINYGVRNIGFDCKVVIWEGDIVMPHIGEFIDDVKGCGYPSSGFNAIYRMDREETGHFLETDEFPTFHRTNALGFSHANGQAGGITVIDRDLFMELKGIPQMFEGTWGNDDNAFWYKLNAFGYSFRNMGRLAYHLHHDHRTERDEEIRKQIDDIREWDSVDWQKYNNSINDDWGKI